MQVNFLISPKLFVDKDDGDWSEIPYEDTEKNLKWSLEIIKDMKNLVSVVTTSKKTDVTTQSMSTTMKSEISWIEISKTRLMYISHL